mmetsp:Transcript_4744/g.12202  ORF Transcript_4744/g.12202 Transcript_4744/m.12202 type:complete len:261 (-) Transcript_4744:414-1196(-)
MVCALSRAAISARNVFSFFDIQSDASISSSTRLGSSGMYEMSVSTSSSPSNLADFLPFFPFFPLPPFFSEGGRADDGCRAAEPGRAEPGRERMPAVSPADSAGAPSAGWSAGLGGGGGGGGARAAFFASLAAFFALATLAFTLAFHLAASRAAVRAGVSPNLFVRARDLPKPFVHSQSIRPKWPARTATCIGVSPLRVVTASFHSSPRSVYSVLTASIAVRLPPRTAQCRQDMPRALRRTIDAPRSSSTRSMCRSPVSAA